MKDNAMPPRREFFTAWSASRYNGYTECPRRAKLEHLDRIAGPKSPAMDRGIQVHEAAEQYIHGLTTKLPADLRAFKELMVALRKRYRTAQSTIAVEEQWGFNADWQRVDWFASDCWARVKIDAIYVDGSTVHIIDWKTGKFYAPGVASYLLQLDLYALSALLVFRDKLPDVRVLPRLCYVDSGKVYAGEKEFGDAALSYSLDDLSRLQKEWTTRVQPMLNDRTFAPRPNRFCYRCHYRKDNAENGGGQCEF